MTPRNFRMAAQTIGLVLVTLGTAAVDWRAGVILLGSVLFAFGVHATIRSMRPQ